MVRSLLTRLFAGFLERLPGQPAIATLALLLPCHLFLLVLEMAE
jgi:hypothetical protein